MNSLNLDTSASQGSADMRGLEYSEAAARSSAVCIAGMHRSGTSMVAGLLQNCGVFLGSDEDLAPPSFDNPGGFWENQHFVKLNDALIAQRGGQWDEPPTFPAGWEEASEIVPLLGQAGELVERLRTHCYWGWKDPRNSLTIAFWCRLIPDLKVVVCVRNPVEVSQSLFVRGDTASASQVELWLTYYREILAAVPPAQRVVTHYESYFQDARAEMRRVLEWLGLDVSDENLDHACAGISAGLRHHHVTTADLNELGAPPEVRDLYLDLCAEAGPVYQRASGSNTRPEAEQLASGGPTEVSNPYRMQIMQMESSMARRDRRIKLLEIELAAARATLKTHEAELSSLKPVLRALSALRSLRARFGHRE